MNKHRDAEPPSETAAVDAREVVDALARSVIVTTPAGRILLWNAAAERLYGWAEAEVVGRDIREVLVAEEDLGRADDIMAVVTSGETWRGDFFIRRRDGEMVWASVSDRPLLGADGLVRAVVGVSEDVADQRLLEREAVGLADHLSLALDAGGLGTWRWDMASGEVLWDARLEALWGLEAGTFDGTFEAYRQGLHPDDVASVLATVEAAVRDRTGYTVDHRVVWSDGSIHWLQGKGQVIVDEQGRVTGTIGCVADVTEQALVAQERERSVAAALEAVARERLSAERLEFLGRINEVLAASETPEDVMRGVTRAAVPTLGEWCAIFVLPENGSPIPDIEIAHSDPRMVSYAGELQARFPYDPTAPAGVPHVIRTGTSEFIPEIDEQFIAEARATDEARVIVRDLRLSSAMAVPLVKRGRVVGALQFVNTDASRVYRAEDLALAEAVASRIASTLENRRLAAHQRSIATTLQASLLPASLPTIDGVEIAVRYWAAGEGTEVGGDFYDAFEVGDHWAVVIGDVCGTGPEAAALTGLVRHTIRAAAWSGASAEEVLLQLNRAVLRSDRTTFCTALFCELHRIDDGFRISVTAGGHPLPIIRRHDGRGTTVGKPGSLIGAFETAKVTTCIAELRAGDAMLLYTDGITDLPAPHGLDCDEMVAIVARAGQRARSADDVASNLGDVISAKLPLTERNDDIALLVLKIV